MGMVRVVSTGGMGRGTKVTDEAGVDLSMVSAIAVSIPGYDQEVRVELTLCAAEIDVEGEARFVLVHPVTKESKLVSRVIFEDGSEFAPGPVEPPAPKTVRLLGGREVPVRG